MSDLIDYFRREHKVLTGRLDISILEPMQAGIPWFRKT